MTNKQDIKSVYFINQTNKNRIPVWFQLMFSYWHIWNKFLILYQRKHWHRRRFRPEIWAILYSRCSSSVGRCHLRTSAGKTVFTHIVFMKKSPETWNIYTASEYEQENGKSGDVSLLLSVSFDVTDANDLMINSCCRITRYVGC